MDDVPLSYNLLLIILLLLLSGFFSTAEGSLFSLSRHQRDRLKKEGRKSSKLIEKLLHEPYKLIITILFADEVVNVAYTSIIGLTVNELLHGYSERSVTIYWVHQDIGRKDRVRAQQGIYARGGKGPCRARQRRGGNYRH